MNSERITSWLMHANWLFLAVWLGLLALAVRACFPEGAGSTSELRRRSPAQTLGD